VPTAGSSSDVSTGVEFHLLLDQPYLDAERVIALARTRGHAIRLLALRPGKDCWLQVEDTPQRLDRLEARLRRLPGVRVSGRRELTA
jgi:hypothetical protein